MEKKKGKENPQKSLYDTLELTNFHNEFLFYLLGGKK